MSIYYSQRTSTLQKVYERIEDTCTRHIGVAEFDCGDLTDFGKEYNYPLVYLETITEASEGERKRTETYTVAINVLDRQPDASDRMAVRQSHDKVKQIFGELKGYMEKKDQFGDVNVSPAHVLLFNYFNDAKLVRLRAEFTVTVDKVNTDLPDLSAIFRD